MPSRIGATKHEAERIEVVMPVSALVKQYMNRGGISQRYHRQLREVTAKRPSVSAGLPNDVLLLAAPDAHAPIVE